MKKFIVFFLLCVFLFTASLFKKEFDFSNYPNLSVQIFTSTQNSINALNVVNNGQGQIITCNYDDYLRLCKSLNNISGVTFIFEGNKQVYKELIKKLDVKIIENTDNSFVGYTNNFSSSVSYSGKKVNIQGYCDNGKIFVGTPLLLGSY